MTITSGTHTFGAGGEYADLYAALVDIANEAVPPFPQINGDITLVQVGDCDVNDLVSILPGYRSYGYKLTITSDKPHYGETNKGWLINFNTSIYIDLQRFGNHEISGLNIKATGNFIGFKIYIGYGAAELVAFRHDSTSKIYNNIFNCNNQLNCSPFSFYNNSKKNAVLELYRNKIFGHHLNMLAFDFAFSSGAFTNDYKVENNSLYGDGVGMDCAPGVSDPPLILKNNAVYSPTQNCYRFGLNQEAYNNISSDDTADDAPVQLDNYINAVFADEFKSLDPNNADFLKPVLGQNSSMSGVSQGISSNRFGIEGNPSPWS